MLLGEMGGQLTQYVVVWTVGWEEEIKTIDFIPQYFTFTTRQG